MMNKRIQKVNALRFICPFKKLFTHEKIFSLFIIHYLLLQQ